MNLSIKMKYTDKHSSVVFQPLSHTVNQSVGHLTSFPSAKNESNVQKGGMTEPNIWLISSFQVVNKVNLGHFGVIDSQYFTSSNKRLSCQYFDQINVSMFLPPVSKGERPCQPGVSICLGWLPAALHFMNAFKFCSVDLQHYRYPVNNSEWVSLFQLLHFVPINCISHYPAILLQQAG